MSTMPGGPRHPAADRLSAWLAGDLGERDTAVVRAHVDACGACAGVVAELRAQGAGLRALERPEPPPTLWPTIAGALETRDGSPPWAPLWSPSWSSSWSWPAWLSGALAGASLAACVAWLVVGRGDAAGTGRPLHAAPDGVTSGPVGRTLRPGSDPLLAEAEGELDRAADSYAEAARRLRAILDREQARWAPETRARVAERLARLDEAIVHSRAVANRDPGDSAGAEMLFSAYQRQIDFLAEAVHRGSPGPDEGWR